LPFGFVFLAVAGCGSQAAVCDSGVRPSVFGTVVGPEGNALPDTVVTYSVDGEERGECTFTEGAAFVCGEDETGAFVLTASLRGYYYLTSELTVYAGACAVNSAVVELVMEPRDCTAVEVPSVEVALTTQSGALPTNASVHWRLATDADDVREPCAGSDTAWECGDDLEGEFVVYAEADGLPESSQSAAVVLSEDGCHVETVALAFEVADGG
jgi:hypothetical protein